MFQSGGFPIPYGIAMGLPWQEVLFGDLRFKGSLRLPGAYRSLARPSSAPEPSNPPNGVALAQLRPGCVCKPLQSNGNIIDTPFVGFPLSPFSSTHPHMGGRDRLTQMLITNGPDGI